MVGVQVPVVAEGGLPEAAREGLRSALGVSTACLAAASCVNCQILSVMQPTKADFDIVGKGGRRPLEIMGPLHCRVPLCNGCD